MTMQINNATRITATSKPLSIANDYTLRRSVAAAIAQAAEGVITRTFRQADLAAGEFVVGVIPSDATLTAVYIKAGTAGGTGDATVQVEVAGTGIHAAATIDDATVKTPTLTTTAGTAGDVVTMQYTEDTTGEPQELLVQLVYRVVDDKYNDRS